MKDVLKLVEVQILKKEAIEEIIDLQQKVTDALEDKSLYIASDREEMEDMLGEEGIVLGARIQGTLVAYFMAWFPKESHKNLGLDIGLNEKELKKVVHFEATIVDPDYRGYHLQRRLMQSLLIEVKKRYQEYYILATVSPYNIYSLKNFLEEGFYITCIKQKYGQLLRCILLKSTKDSEIAEGQDSQAIAYKDVEAQKDLLEKGYLGRALQGSKDEAIIIYTKK